MEELKKEKRKHIITTVLLIIGAIILAGTAYAIYNWIYEGVTENTLTTPEAELEFLESNNEIYEQSAPFFNFCHYVVISPHYQ